MIFLRVPFLRSLVPKGSWWKIRTMEQLSQLRGIAVGHCVSSHFCSSIRWRSTMPRQNCEMYPLKTLLRFLSSDFTSSWAFTNYQQAEPRTWYSFVHTISSNYRLKLFYINIDHCPYIESAKPQSMGVMLVIFALTFEI